MRVRVLDKLRMLDRGWWMCRVEGCDEMRELDVARAAVAVMRGSESEG